MQKQKAPPAKLSDEDYKMVHEDGWIKIWQGSRFVCSMPGANKEEAKTILKALNEAKDWEEVV